MSAINAIPIVGWIVDFLIKCSVSVPFWFFWTVLDIGKEYFDFLPQKYQAIGFWDTVCLFVVIGFMGMIIKMVSPFSIKVESSKSD